MTIQRFCDQELTLDNHQLMVPVIELWDSLFSLSYFEFRSRVNEIAVNTWSHVSGVNEIIYGMDEMDNLLETDGDPIVVPVDDDDWFSPNLGDIRNHLKNDKKWTAWNDALFTTGLQEQPGKDIGKLEFNEKKVFQVREFLSSNNPEAISKTNSIAFRLSALPRKCSRAQLLDTMCYHARVGLMLGGNRKTSLPVNFIPASGRYSVINRNLSSITLIFPWIRFILNNPSLFYEQACKVACFDAENIPEIYYWARKPVREMCDLYRILVN